MKNLVFIINAHQAFIKNLKSDFITQNELLFTAISNTYLPLLRMFDRLKQDFVPFKLAMVFSPCLCELLSDPIVQAQYIKWLERLITLGKSELKRTKKNTTLNALAQKYLNTIEQNLFDFTEVYNQNILEQFAQHAKEGTIELLATAATHCFFPLYADLPEIVSAQIEAGLFSHKHFFGSSPDGFWLPYMGYFSGIENYLRSYGFLYTLVDTHSFLFSTPPAEYGTFLPARCNNSVVVFARDFQTPKDVISKESGFCHNSVYLDQEKDVGFEQSLDYMKDFFGSDGVRISTGFSYYTQDSSEKMYSAEAALEQSKKDAAIFIENKITLLEHAQNFLPEKSVCSVCCFDAEIFGQIWYEGISWLEAVLREIACQSEIALAHPMTLALHDFKLQKINPFPSSALEDGYAEVFFDSANSWMIPYLRKACERMIDLTKRFPHDTGIKERSLNFAARQLLIAQSGDWARMIKNDEYASFARNQFIESIGCFSQMYDSLGSGSINAEWLIRKDAQTGIFPWMNYRIFSSKS